MMSAVAVMPIETMMARGAMMTDDARTVHGYHPATATAGDKGGIDGGIIVIVGVIIVGIIVVIDPIDKNATDVTAVDESVTGKSVRSCRRGSGANRTRADNRSANATATAEATGAAAAAAASSAMAADFDRRTVGRRLARSR
jgi:hypothetical protein